MLQLLVLIPALLLGSTLPLLLLEVELFAAILTSVALLALLLPFKAIYYVSPSERRVLINIMDGQPRTLASGIHLVLNPLYIEQNPKNSSWRVFKRFPEVGTR